MAAASTPSLEWDTPSQPATDANGASAGEQKHFSQEEESFLPTVLSTKSMQYREVGRGVPHKLVQLLSHLYQSEPEEAQEKPLAGYMFGKLQETLGLDVGASTKQQPTRRDLTEQIKNLQSRVASASELLDSIELKVQGLQSLLADRIAERDCIKPRGRGCCCDDEIGIPVEKIENARYPEKRPTADVVQLRNVLQKQLDEASIAIRVKDDELKFLHDRVRHMEQEAELRAVSAGGTPQQSTVPPHSLPAALAFEQNQTEVMDLRLRLERAAEQAAGRRYSVSRHFATAVNRNEEMAFRQVFYGWQLAIIAKRRRIRRKYDEVMHNLGWRFGAQADIDALREYLSIWKRVLNKGKYSNAPLFARAGRTHT